MPAGTFRIVDRGDHRVLTVAGRDYRTYYSERVLRLLIERKGEHRAALYLDFKRTRGELFMGPLFTWLRAHGAAKLTLLEVGCSFGHMTEYVADQPEAASVSGVHPAPALVGIPPPE